MLDLSSEGCTALVCEPPFAEPLGLATVEGATPDAAEPASRSMNAVVDQTGACLGTVAEAFSALLLPLLESPAASAQPPLALCVLPVGDAFPPADAEDASCSCLLAISDEHAECMLCSDLPEAADLAEAADAADLAEATDLAEAADLAEPASESELDELRRRRDRGFEAESDDPRECELFVVTGAGCSVSLNGG